MSFQVLRASDELDRSTWLAALSEWPQAEVFAHPSYSELFKAEGDEVICASWTSAEIRILYPLLVRPIEGTDLVDLITPYGYGGPFCWAGQPDEVLETQFWSALSEWARERNAISEFVRFSLFEEERLRTYPGQRIHKLTNVVRSLDLNEDDLWHDIEHKVRKNVKRARSVGIEIVCDLEGQRFDDFERIYRETMTRRNAASGYYFPTAFFDKIHSELGGYFAYFHALLEGAVIASELVLLSKQSSYSFLGGTDEKCFEHRPNDLLKFEIIRWSAANNRKNFVLGGGYQPNDGIFRYKQSFAPKGMHEFFVGTRILNQGMYDFLVADRKLREPDWQPNPDFFPLYRG